MSKTEELDKACSLLREKIDKEIADRETREAVYLLIDAHDSAKQTVSLLRNQLETVYKVIEKVTSHPEFKKLMEEAQ